MRIIKRKRPRPKHDRWAHMRGIPGSVVPDLFKPRKHKKDADPEAILQYETNEVLTRANQFYFRLSERVLEKAGDWTVAGWPDNPMITMLQPGLSLLGPLELKKEGEQLNPSQVDMQRIIGTVKADTWPTAWAYINWYWKAVEKIRNYLRDNPLPPAPETP